MMKLESNQDEPDLRQILGQAYIDQTGEDTGVEPELPTPETPQGETDEPTETQQAGETGDQPTST